MNEDLKQYDYYKYAEHLYDNYQPLSYKDKSILFKQLNDYDNLTEHVKGRLVDYIDHISEGRHIATDSMYGKPFDDKHFIYVKSIVTRLTSMTEDEKLQIETINRAIAYKFEPLPNAFKYTPIEYNVYKAEKIKGIRMSLWQELWYREAHEGFANEYEDYYITKKNINQLSYEIFDILEKYDFKKEKYDVVIYNDDYFKKLNEVQEAEREEKRRRLIEEGLDPDGDLELQRHKEYYFGGYNNYD